MLMGKLGLYMIRNSVQRDLLRLQQVVKPSSSGRFDLVGSQDLKKLQLSQEKRNEWENDLARTGDGNYGKSRER